jgi:hypothetical protein
MKRIYKYSIVLLIILISCIVFQICIWYKNKDTFATNDDENIIYCFWTGNNEISENRQKAIDNLIQNSECNLILITPDNLQSYILPEHPLHEAYPYLSFTHRSDYLRTYFMHFHGGGYSDIKKTPSSWKPAFEDMKQNPEAYINGYPEKCGADIAYEPVSHLYDKLVGNGCYIVKPNTSFTQEWYSEMITLLDTKLPVLKKMTVDPNVRDNQSSEYPIQWNEMLGRIFHKVLAKYVDNNKILCTVPQPIMSDYR